MTEQSNNTHSQWQRFLYMMLFGIILYIAGITIFVLVIVQFIFTLVSSDENSELKRLGNSIAKFFHDVIQFLSYNSEDKPFPFAPWPKADIEEAATETAEPQTDAKQPQAGSSKAEEDAEDAVIVLENDSGATEPKV